MLCCEQGVGPVDDGLALVSISQETPAKIEKISDIFAEAHPIMVRKRLHSSSSIHTLLEDSLEYHSRASIDEILEAVGQLSPLEKMLLYLKLPTGRSVQDPLKHPTNPLGSRPEITMTVSWIKTHLQEDNKTSLPKQDVYNEYLEYCHMNNMKPLSTADFGKVMKQVYPNMRPRRLGTRGNSRYCYSGLSSRTSLPTPSLPVLPSLDGSVVCRWAAKVLGYGETFSSIADLENYLLDNNIVSAKNATSHYHNCCTNDKLYAMSSKICRSQDKKTEDRKKMQENPPTTSKAAPEHCKFKRSNSGGLTMVAPVKKGPTKRYASSTPTSTVPAPLTPVTPISQPDDQLNSPTNMPSDTSSSKLPIPRLPKIPPNKILSVQPQAVKKNKPIVPKDLIGDSNNSFEQEEELLNYFRKQGDDDSKCSTLRMLLERSKEHGTDGNRVTVAVNVPVRSKTVAAVSTNVTSTMGSAHRRVCFDPLPPPPETPQKKFSFVPISPISRHSPILQFVKPQTQTSLPSPLTRPASGVDPPLSALLITSSSKPSSETHLLHNILDNAQLYPNGWRSQSVPTCILPEFTPVPSETADFDMTESENSNLLESDSLGGTDNLGQILSYITELESPTIREGRIDPEELGNDTIDQKPTFSASYAPISPFLDASTDLFDESLSLDCGSAFESLAADVCTDTKEF